MIAVTGLELTESSSFRLDPSDFLLTPWVGVGVFAFMVGLNALFSLLVTL